MKHAHAVAALAKTRQERDEAIERCDALELAVHENLPEVTTDADGALESDEVCRIETVGLLYSEAQRENERLADEVRTYQIVLTEKGRDVEHLRHWLAEWQKKAEEAEQHVAALRDALEQAADAMDAARGDSRITGASITARAILANTAAGSAAWLTAHDAEKDAQIAALVALLYLECEEGYASKRAVKFYNDLPASAAAYTADVRRAALEPLRAHILQIAEWTDARGEYDAVKIADALRALAAQPEQT